ncbi:MAG: nucleotidyltransferase domain-containing protein [Candidatus Methanomethyliaceae archaeon]
MNSEKLDYLETLVEALRDEAIRRSGIRLQRLKELSQSKNLDFVVLFGSFAHGDATAESDVDIAYFGDKGTPIDPKEWAGISNRPVDAHDLRKASISLRYEVAMMGFILYERHPDAFLFFRCQVKKEFKVRSETNAPESLEGAVALDEFIGGFQ